MLFGLCLLERRAKENAIVNNRYRQNPTLSANLSYKSYADQKNLHPLKGTYSQRFDFATRFLSDTINGENITYQTSHFNIAMSSPFQNRR